MQSLFGRKSIRLNQDEPSYTSLLRVCDLAGLNGFELEGKKVAHKAMPVNDRYSWLVGIVQESVVHGQKPRRTLVTTPPPVPMHISPLRAKKGNAKVKADAFAIRKTQNDEYTQTLLKEIKRFTSLNHELGGLYAPSKKLSIAAVPLSRVQTRDHGVPMEKTEWLVAALLSHDHIVREKIPQKLLQVMEPRQFWELLQAVREEREKAERLLHLWANVAPQEEASSQPIVTSRRVE